MPSDYTDYENNLAFAPKSADDLNKQKRESDVLIAAVEKCEKLEKQLKIAVEALKKYANKDYWKNHYEIGLSELKVFDDGECDNGEFSAQQALKQIKELDK